MTKTTLGLFAKRQVALFVALAASTHAFAQNENVDEIQVVGSRAALQNALSRQRNADQVVGVIDSDALGNFADINVSESLRRISGIMVENDQGEGRYVSVRGMNTDLNAMTINGVSTASPEDRRGIMLDGVPTDMLDSMTVYKTLNPSLDADTIGGAIDLETYSAFSKDGAFVRLKAETSYNELTKDGSNPTLSATLSNRFLLGDGELGAALILTDQERHIEAQNNENGGWSDIAPNDDYEMRYYDLTRERQGVVLNLDYMANSGNKYFLHLFHNEYADTEYRGKWETHDGLADNEATVNGDVFTYANNDMDSEGRDRREVREISAMQVGAEFAFGNGMTLATEVFGSRAEQDDSDAFDLTYRTDFVDTPLSYDNSNPRKPVLNFVPEFYDPDFFLLDSVEKEEALTTDRDNGFKADLTMNFNSTTDLQFGMKYRSREKDNQTNVCVYEPLNDITMAERGVRNIDRYLSNQHGPAPSIANLRGFDIGGTPITLSDGSLCPGAGSLLEYDDDEEASIAEDWNTEEDILALYGMATTTFDRGVMVYGLRYEDTSSTYSGKSFDSVTEAFAGKVSFDNDYDFWAPSFNLKYQIDDQRIARVGIFRSLVRPGFNESRASALIDLDDNEIESGNPDLEPTKAWNFDLTYEWYLSEDTFIGAGAFYKRIEDAIVEVESDNFSLRGQVWDEASTFINSEDSSIAGLEFSLQTAWDNGLLMVVNYTYADGETDLPDNSASGERTIPYFKQAQDTANFVVGYNKYGIDVRLAVNYRGEYLDELGDEALNDRYTSDHMQVDLTARYSISENLQLSGAILNLNDRPEYYYFGNESRLSQYDEYGATYTMGLRYVF